MYLNTCNFLSIYWQVQNAQEYGAAGIILYTDPADYAVDGESSVYPDSWWLPGTGVQRGTVGRTDGDPLTQGYPAIGQYSLLVLYDRGFV